MPGLTKLLNQYNKLNQAKKRNKMKLMEHKDIFVYLDILATDI